MGKGDSYGFPKSIPERRGFAPVPSDRVKKYSVDSYIALYGIPEILAERFRDESNSHSEVERRIVQHFSKHPDMRQQALEEYDGPGAREVTPEEAAELEKKLAKKSWSEIGKEIS